MGDKEKQIIAVYGPKGGVGKSTISANLAITFARLGKKVTAVDLDLGGANLHAILGIKDYQHSLDDFILKEVKDLSQVLIGTSEDNLKVLCGGTRIPDIANMPYQQKIKLMRHLVKLDSDIILLDLAAGSSSNVVDFLFVAHKGLLVTTPEVTSLMKVYGFVKTAVFRRLTFYLKEEKTKALIDLLEQAKDFDNNPHLLTMDGFFEEAMKINPQVARSARASLAKLHPHILVNMVQTAGEENVGKVVQNLMKQYLAIDSTVIATIREDREVKKSIKTLTPIAFDNPAAPFSLSIKELALRLLKKTEPVDSIPLAFSNS